MPTPAIAPVLRPLLFLVGAGVLLIVEAPASAASVEVKSPAVGVDETTDDADKTVGTGVAIVFDVDATGREAPEMEVDVEDAVTVGDPVIAGSEGATSSIEAVEVGITCVPV